MHHLKTNLIAFLLLLSLASLFAQDDDFWDEFLNEEIEVENPIYLPVVGIGVGHLNFMGDVKNNSSMPLTGQLGYNVNVATFIDNGHRLRANFFFSWGGKLNGENRDLTDPRLNYNFQTDILNFGINVNYSLGNVANKNRKIVPFVALGISNMQFNPKGDTTSTYGPYNYWSDGSIRDVPESQKNNSASAFIARDHVYETDLRDADLYGHRGKISQYESANTFAVPIDAGFDLVISPRVFLRLGYSFNFVFSDYIDNLSGTLNPYKGINRGGNKTNDMYSFTYAALHLDLFSPPKTIIVERLFADIDFDPTLIGDEDYDMVFDVSDECPGTPPGVEVDSVGCPFDDDGDGVPNHMDKEPGTAKNAFVNEFGQTYNINELIALLDASEAVRRDEVDIQIMNYLSRSKASRYGNLIVPQKFKKVDTDADGYISFEEVLETIDQFFDFGSDLSTDEIYELNEFFFSQ
ncbi:MAG: EF-hand domain-containing protein [Bacteroidales bacterium]|nr:EF-hand domain-containing protein [Bacteroidales bacterium]